MLYQALKDFCYSIESQTKYVTIKKNSLLFLLRIKEENKDYPHNKEFLFICLENGQCHKLNSSMVRYCLKWIRNCD
jgi:hypothetical protein